MSLVYVKCLTLEAQVSRRKNDYFFMCCCFSKKLKQNIVLAFASGVNRDAAEEKEDSGHVSSLCAWRGKPRWLEAQRRQSDPGAPVRAGENGTTA